MLAHTNEDILCEGTVLTLRSLSLQLQSSGLTPAPTLLMRM